MNNLVDTVLLAMYRRREGYTQTGFASSINMSIQKYSLLEQGKKDFKMKDLEKIMKKLKLKKEEKLKLINNLL